MDTPHKHSYALPLLFSVVLILGMWLGFKLADSIKKQTTISAAAESNLQDIIALVADKYVDTIDEKKLYQDGVNGILTNLDPHTVYIPKEELTRVNEELEGSFYGIGVEFYNYKDTVRISSILAKGPSYGLHIYPGDRILKINDSLVAGKKMADDDIINAIRGKQHTAVALTLQHPDNTIEKVTIERNTVPINSVVASFKLKPDVGYILIRMFSEHTYEEFVVALKKLQANGIDKLIIDVRDNPGGYMEAVAQIADEMIAGKHILVSTKGKNSADIVSSKTTGIFEKGKVAILINENSASASEILAGVIQDLDRGIVVGRRSYGKGLVQEQFELPDHAALRITTARYYLPSNRCIQRSYADGKTSYKHDIEERYIHGELTSSDSVHNDKLKGVFYTSKKRKVFGGEGISPDFFVAIDTSNFASINYIQGNHIASNFASDYYFNNKKTFPTFTSAEKFASEFTLNKEMQNAKTEYLKQFKLPVYLYSYKSFMQQIDMYIKAELGKIIYGYNTYYAVLSQDDAVIKKAEKELD